MTKISHQQKLTQYLTVKTRNCYITIRRPV